MENVRRWSPFCLSLRQPPATVSPGDRPADRALWEARSAQFLCGRAGWPPGNVPGTRHPPAACGRRRLGLTSAESASRETHAVEAASGRFYAVPRSANDRWIGRRGKMPRLRGAAFPCRREVRPLRAPSEQHETESLAADRVARGRRSVPSVVSCSRILHMGRTATPR